MKMKLYTSRFYSAVIIINQKLKILIIMFIEILRSRNWKIVERSVKSEVMFGLRVIFRRCVVYVYCCMFRLILFLLCILQENCRFTRKILILFFDPASKQIFQICKTQNRKQKFKICKI